MPSKEAAELSLRPRWSLTDNGISYPFLRSGESAGREVSGSLTSSATSRNFDA